MPKISFNFVNFHSVIKLGPEATIAFGLVMNAMARIGKLSEIIEVVLVECVDYERKRFSAKIKISFPENFEHHLCYVPVPKTEATISIETGGQIDEAAFAKQFAFNIKSTIERTAMSLAGVSRVIGGIIKTLEAATV